MKATLLCAISESDDERSLLNRRLLSLMSEDTRPLAEPDMA
jgi:hypothetical protein